MELQEKILKQALFSVAYLLMGMSLFVRGTCFVDLKEIYNASTQSLSYGIGLTGLGIMISSLIAGHLQHHYENKGLLQISFFLLITAMATVPQAHVKHLWAFFGVSFSLGFGFGGVLSIIRNQCLIIWRGTRFGPGPFLQLIFFFQGIGFLLAPLVGKQFLSTSTDIDDSIKKEAHTSSIDQLFPTLGALIGIMAVVFFILGFRQQCFSKKLKSEKKEKGKMEKSSIDQMPFSWKQHFLIFTMLFGFFSDTSLVTCISSYLIPTLRDSPLSLSKQDGANLQSIFFCGVLLSRLAASVTSLILTPNQTMSAILSLSLFATTGIFILQSSSLIMLQVLYGLLGLGLGSLAPGSIVWLEQFFVLPSKVVASSTLLAAFGNLMTMVILGSFLDLVQNIIFYYQFGVIVVCSIMFGTGSFLGSAMKEEKETNQGKKEGIDNKAMNEISNSFGA